MKANFSTLSLLKAGGLICLSISLSAHAGLIQDLDGSVAASVITNGAGAVTSLTDQSGSANNASTSAGSVTYPATNLLNGLKALNFGPSRSSLQAFSSAASSAWLNQSGGTNGFCVLVAFHLRTLTNLSEVVGNSSGNTPAGFLLRCEPGGIMRAALGGQVITKSSPAAAAGDTLIFAFNYNAVAGQFEFWDSKSQSSVWAYVAASNFTQNAAVTLGSTVSATKYLDGQSGEVQVFDRALSATDFEQAYGDLTLKWTGVTPVPTIRLDWRVMTNTGYPTDDAVVYAVSISDPGVQALMPTNPATGDCTTAFQAALDAIATGGGGTVFVPAGKYLFTNNLTIPSNVILRGAWQPLTNDAPGPVAGTVLMPTAGAGQGGGAPFILLGQNESGVKDLSIWYPNQKATNVVVYPPAIGQINYNTSAIFLQNLNLVNAYGGIVLSNFANLGNVLNIYGSPLHEGLYSEGSSEISRYNNINFSPDYWALSGLSNAPTVGGPQAGYIYTNGTGCHFSGFNNVWAVNWKITGYYRGLYEENEGNASGNNFWGYSVIITNCQQAVWADALGESYLMRCIFDAAGESFHLSARPNALVGFNQCVFSSATGSYSFDYGYAGNLANAFSFQGCTFNRPVNLSTAVQVSMVNCQFTCLTNAVSLGKKAVSGNFLGNTFAYSPGVVTNAATSAALVIDSRPVTCAVPPVFNVTNYIHMRQPGRLVIAVGGVNFSVRGDGVTDDSTNIQAALTTMGNNGGGIVFLPLAPQGYAIFHPLYVPTKVELRGILDSMPDVYNVTSNPGDGTLLQVYYGAGLSQPCINLNDGSGAKGFVFHYPQQFDTNIVPYSPAIGGTGTNIYVQYCINLNAYGFLQLSNADNHLVEHCFLDPVNAPLTIQNSSNGRIQNMCLKAYWAAAGFPTATNSAVSQAYYLAHATDLNLLNCTNESILFSWNRLSYRLGQVESSSVQALNWSDESNFGQLKVINPLPGGLQLLQMSGRCNANNGDTATTMVAFDISGTTNSGSVNIFNGWLTGDPDWLLSLSNANCTVQDCNWNLDSVKVGSRGLYLNGSSPSVCRFDNVTFSTYTPFYVTNAPNKRIELAGCNFYEGGQFDTYTNSTVGSLSVGYITSGTRLATMATLGPVAAAVGLNTDPQFPADANLLTNVANQSHILTNAVVSVIQLTNTLAGWMPVKVGTNAMFLDVDVTSAWMTNSAVTNLQMLVNYYDGGTGGIKVYYS